ncbi:MAG: D-alanyl-D-alanine carboxypeptidase/D-alanyl-D-alanine-endopeptidase [Muribaculaceae bacterium]
MKLLRHILCICATAAVLGVPVDGRCENAMQNAVDKFALGPTLRHASVGVCVMRLDSGLIVAGHAPEQSLITASTMKTVTSATALELLGKDFTFGTHVYAVGRIDNHGTLKGNLLVKGGGDPTLGSRYFPSQPAFADTVAAVLKQCGIGKINGRIEVDGTAIPYPPVSPRWMVEDLGYDYGAGCFGLCFADNVLTLSFDRSGEEPEDFSISPQVEGIDINSHIVLGDKGDTLPVDYIEAIMDYDTPAINLWGGTHRSVLRYADTFANPAPHLLLCDSIERRLDAADIAIRRKRIDAGTLTDTLLLLDYRSPQLTDILKSLLHRSDNMFTEMVLRAVAAADGNMALPKFAIAKVDSLWKAHGVSTDALFMYDGSGLARNGRASARFLCELLRAVYADRDTLGTDFSTLMPVAGLDGTLKSLLRGTALEGRIALKSGSMGDVQCFAGYYPATNPKYSVAVLVNNFNGTRRLLRRNIETLLLELFARHDECGENADDIPAPPDQNGQ